MNDKGSIARQLQRELEQHEEAQDRLERSTRDAEQGSYTSSTKYGRHMMKAALPHIIKRLEEKRSNLGRRRGAVDKTSVYPRIKGAKLDVLALLAMKITFDKLGQDHKASLVSVTTAVGRAVETELRLREYRKQDSDLYRRVSKSFHKSTGTRQKATVYKLRFNSAGIEWNTWPEADCHKIGAWLIDGIASTTGWITYDTMVSKKAKKNQIRVSTDRKSVV